MKKTVWLVVSGLMAAALVLASCAPAATGPTEAQTVRGTTTAPAPATTTTTPLPASTTPTSAPEVGAVMVENIWGNLVEEPRYGGTIRYRTLPHNAEHYDPLWWAANATNSIINDRYGTAPWEKGPEGSGEYALDYSSYTQDVYRGELMVGWEQFDLNTCQFTLKKGIRFWDKPPVNGRELTIDDTIWSWIRGGAHPVSNWYWDQAEASTFWETELSKIDDGTYPLSKLTDHLEGMENIWLPQLVASGYDVDDVNVTKRYPSVAATLRRLTTTASSSTSGWPTSRYGTT